MAARNEITLGYGGGAYINGQPVLITSGNISQTVNEPVVLPYDMPHITGDGADRFDINLGDGTYSYNGSISFDYTLEAVEELITKTFLSRNSEFDVVIHNGDQSYQLNKCKWSSFTISVSPQSLVTGSISFQSTNGNKQVLEAYSGAIQYIFDHELLAYWNTGNEEIESFNISLNQGLTPVYLNGNQYNPAYIRGGAITGTIQVNAWERWLTHTSVKIANKNIAFSKFLKEAMEFTYGGPAATGYHNYTVTVHGDTASNEQILVVT